MLNEDNNVSLLDLVRIKILKDKAFSMHTNIRKERSRDSYRLCRFFFWECQVGAQKDNKPIKLLPTFELYEK